MNRRKNGVILFACIALLAFIATVPFLLQRENDGWDRPGSGSVVLSEIMASNHSFPAPNGAYLDFVEVRNLSTSSVDISGYMLADDELSIGYTFPKGTVLPGNGYLVCWCMPDSDSGDYAAFGISRRGGETIYLYNSANVIVDMVTLSPMEPDTSAIRVDETTWNVVAMATPGYENTEEGYQRYLHAKGVKDVPVVISEVMTSNRSTLLSDAGTLCDWVELLNTGNSTVILENCYLSDDIGQRAKWSIPSMTLEPGERKVIRCAGAAASENEADFRLPKSGCTVLLAGQNGLVIDMVDCPRIEDDHTWALRDDGTYGETEMPSPGYANTEEGYLKFKSTQTVKGPLIISEVMPSNDQYLIQSDGSYYDWVELMNISDAELLLSDYFLSEDADKPTKFRLPDRILNPGERIVVICSANDKLTGNYIQAPFTLSSSECWVYLADSFGRLCDYIRVSGVPEGGSAGRVPGENGTWYFEYATPGSANGTGVALISERPVFLTAEGIYQDVSKVTVEIQGSGKLHYTLDGSAPTEDDPVYSKPLTIKETTVIRVASFEKGKLPSKTVTACYFLNENHTLPVLSLAVDPEEMFGQDGIYTNTTIDVEKPSNLKYYSDDGMFSIDCGVQMTGKTVGMKKNLKISFRGRYGAKVLGFPLFDGRGAQVFDGLTLSAGSDDCQTMFRDELFSRLAAEFSDTLCVRRSRFCVLYINGEYWGIYSIKENMSELFYAQSIGASEAYVTEIREPVDISSEFYKMGQYCEKNDITDSENYDYVASRIDVNGLIDWMILQGYSCNHGIENDQRYFQNCAGIGKWYFAFSNLDKGFYYRDGFASVFTSEEPRSYVKLVNSLLKNEKFRTKFLTRLQEASQGVLSDAHVLAVMEEYESLLRGEMGRELTRWNRSMDEWTADVNRLKSFLTRYDHWGMLKESLKQYSTLTDAEISLYFGR